MNVAVIWLLYLGESCDKVKTRLTRYAGGARSKQFEARPQPSKHSYNMSSGVLSFCNLKLRSREWGCVVRWVDAVAAVLAKDAHK